MMPKLFGEEGGSKDFDERLMGFFDILCHWWYK